LAETAYERLTKTYSGGGSPADRLRTTYGGGADAAKKEPSRFQDVVGDVLKFYGDRVSATAAEMYDPLIAAVSGQPDRSLPAPLARVALGQAILTGKRPFGGPPTVAEELKQAGFQESPVPEFLGAIPGPLGQQSRVARALTGPTAAGFALEAPVAGAFDAAGGAVLGPAARAVGEPLRRLPGINQALEAVRRGAGLPKKYRDKFYQILRSREGEADFRNFLRQKNLGEHANLPEDVQRRIGDAIELNAVAQLPKAEREVAEALQLEFSLIPKERAAVGGRRFELAQEAKVGYVPRVPKERGVYGEPPVPPPALGTSPGKMRTEAGRELTTKELGGEFLPPVEAALTHGTRADTRIMHMGIVKDLVDKFGKPLSKGQAVGSIRGIPTGFNKGMQARLARTELPKELHEVLLRLNDRMAPEQWGRFSQFVRETNDIFKTTALFSPGFVSRNMQNNVFQTALFGNLDPRTWAYATKVLDGTGGKAEQEFLETAIKNGVLGRGQIAQETSSALTRGRGKLSAPFRAVRKANTAAEDLSRLSFFKWNLDQGLTPAQAAQKVDDVLINYSPRFQGKGMSWARRNAFPFINWTVNAPQVFARSAVLRPGSLGMLGNVRERQIEAKGGREKIDKLPDYLKQAGVVPLGGDRYLDPQGYGSFDVNRLAGAPFEDRPGRQGPGGGITDELLNRAYPQYALAAAIREGRDPFTGFPIKGVKGWTKFLAGKVPATRIPILAYDLASGKKGSKERALSFLTGVKTVERKTP
jgi:hypothetical protein